MAHGNNTWRRTLCFHSKNDLEQSSALVFRAATTQKVAIVKTRSGKGLFVVNTDCEFFEEIEEHEPARIVGVYADRGDKDALLSAITEDITGIFDEFRIARKLADNGG
jgi:hypothetical protein